MNNNKIITGMGRGGLKKLVKRYFQVSRLGAKDVELKDWRERKEKKCGWELRVGPLCGGKDTESFFWGGDI